MKNKLLNAPWLLCLLLIMCAQMSYAQWQNGLWTEKQAYNWYFYQKAGLDFNTNPPSALLDSEMSELVGGVSALEGCGAISDEDGNLLFYVEGTKIWNADHEVMLNGDGLLGDVSTTQTGLVIPSPTDSNIFYIFSQDYQGGSDGLTYSEVDMTLDNGLGAVTANKNIPLMSPVSEKLTAVHHANGSDIWLIAHGIGDSSNQNASGNIDFLSFLIDSSGVNSSPVISSVGAIPAGAGDPGTGTMKASPNGEKIAMTGGVYGIYTHLQLFDFDDSTGQLSNPVDIPSLVNSQGYGLEFSPNNKLLYVVNLGGIFGFNRLYQLDLMSNDIANSALILQENSDAVPWTSLQLAPNGKIYLAGANKDNLSVINYPNNIGLDCDFSEYSVSLANKQTSYGLPGFIQSYFESGILYEGECPGEEIAFSTIRIPGIDAITWDYGDGDTGTGITPTHTYAQAGTYTVTATITSNGAQQTAETEVTILEGAEARTPDAFLSCGGTTTAVFDLTSLNDTILDGQDVNTFTVSYHEDENGAENDVALISPAASYESATGTIYARVTNTGTGCYAVISIALETTPQPTAPSVAPIIACDTEALDGITIIDLTQRATDLRAGQPDTELAYFESQADADKNTNAITDPTAYTNTSNPQAIYVRISNSNLPDCYAVALLDIEVETAKLGGASLELMGCSPFDLTAIAMEVDSDLSLEYYASEAYAEANTNALENPTAYVTTSQEEQVYVRLTDSNGCAGVAELSLVTGDCKIPEGISPNGDGANDSFDLSFLTATYGGKHISIFNRNGRVVYEQNDYSDQWFGQDSNGNNLPTGTYYYVLELAEPHPEYGSTVKKWVYVQREL